MSLPVPISVVEDAPSILSVFGISDDESTDATSTLAKEHGSVWTDDVTFEI